MQLSYLPNKKLFLWRGGYAQRAVPKKAGFDWSSAAKCWYTASPYIAFLLHKWADSSAKQALAYVQRNITESKNALPIIKAENGLYPFQAAGVEFLRNQITTGRRYLLLADEQGLGKTPEAICAADALGFKKLLVICPAGLRLNWCNEIKKWHTGNPGVESILDGKHSINKNGSIVTSYNLIDRLAGYEPDFIIIDEAHYLKNMGAKRTKRILGDGKTPGIIRKAPGLFLTGTPLPNGKPSELWPILFRCAPEIINYYKYYPFLRRFCVFDDANGLIDPQVKGGKRKKELYTRLRGSGFMLRRKKSQVLADLPPKQYKMVIFPATGAAEKVLQKEKRFNAQEIIKHGVPVGEVLPQIRREMGLAKVQQSVGYIIDLLGSGVQKTVVFAHHIDVINELAQKLRSAGYQTVVTIGSTKAQERQANVEAFQTDPNVRVFIGNMAAQEGITLTAARDCVMVEPDWVPGNNEQRADRLHRIGQKNSVLIHILVVEHSLDANILSSAAFKHSDIIDTLDSKAL